MVFCFFSCAARLPHSWHPRPPHSAFKQAECQTRLFDRTGSGNECYAVRAKLLANGKEDRLARAEGLKPHSVWYACRVGTGLQCCCIAAATISPPGLETWRLGRCQTQRKAFGQELPLPSDTRWGKQAKHARPHLGVASVPGRSDTRLFPASPSLYRTSLEGYHLVAAETSVTRMFDPVTGVVFLLGLVSL